MGVAGKGVEIRPNSIRLFFVDGDGNEHRKTLRVGGKVMQPTPANIKFANALAVRIRKEVEVGAFVMAEHFPDDGVGTPGQAVTVGKQLDTWLAAQQIKASTRSGYESAIKFWKATVGERPIRSLRHSHILLALATKSGLSGKTVNNYVSVLRESMQLAVSDKLLGENPVAGIKRARWQKPDVDPFSRDEAEAIIADARSHYPEPIANLIEWRFFTGVRTSEMAGLRWAKVNLAAPAHFIVDAALVRGVEEDSTKTDVTRRVLLNSRALAAIERQRAHTQLAGQHVWLDPRYGEPWHEERAFRRSYWEPCLKRLGIRYRPPNNARHTYATMMLMAGRTPAWCAKQMGHSVEMFLRTYSRWLEGAQDELELQALEGWIGGAKLPQNFPGTSGG